MHQSQTHSWQQKVSSVVNAASTIDTFVVAASIRSAPPCYFLKHSSELTSSINKIVWQLTVCFTQNIEEQKISIVWYNDRTFQNPIKTFKKMSPTIAHQPQATAAELQALRLYTLHILYESGRVFPLYILLLWTFASSGIEFYYLSRYNWIELKIYPNKNSR